MRRILGFALSFALCAAVAACTDTHTPPVAAAPGVADSADQVLVVVHYVLTSKGVQRGVLDADTAYVLDEATRIDLRRARVNFTTELGAPQGTMEANRAVLNQRTQILEGWGDAVVKLVDGRSLRSPHITYNQVTHQISSDTTYTLNRGADTQRGTGFTSNETFSRFSCLRACSGSASVLLPER
ncbi:MAG TPA: LPS export ABC transporter periplasmic protein LptC [Gemmatimonadaceae bacterium]